MMTARNFSWNPFSSPKPVDADFNAAVAPPPAEPVVTTKTPELAPETLNTSAVTDTTAAAAANNAASSGGSSWYNPLSWGSKSAEPPAALESAPSTGIPQPSTPATEPVVATTPAKDATVLADPAPAHTIDEILESATDITKIPDDQIGYLKQLGLDFGWGPTAINEWILEHIHVYGGVGWGLSIIGATLVIRIILLKPMMYTSDNAAKMSCMTPILGPLRKKQIELSRTAGSTAASRIVKQQIQHTYAQAGVSSWKGLIAPALQGIFGYGTFRLLRAMSTVPVPGLGDAGWAWFTNLTVSDPYYILPLAIGISMHLTARWRPENTTNTMISPVMNMLFVYVLPVFIFLVSAWLPAALQISFMTSNLWGLAQQSLLRFDSTRRMLGLTPFPSPESLQFFERVNRGEITIRHALVLLKQAKAAPHSAAIPTTATSTTMKYEAPTVKSSISLPALPADKTLNLRRGVTMPPHIAVKTPAGTSMDGLEDAPPPEGFKAKFFWLANSMRWKNLKPRLLAWYSAKTGIDTAARLGEERKRLAKKKADEYEWRRKEALKHK
jgi:YidC/Oxa1 family membrane protein insertase